MVRSTRIWLGVGALVLVACGGGENEIDGGVGCTPTVLFGLHVTLTDAATRGPVEGALMTLAEGSYAEILQELDPGHYVGAAERSGTYRLTIEAEGYEDGSRERIHVAAGVCHVTPVQLEIALTTR